MLKLSSKIVAIVISLLMIFSIGGASTSLFQNAHAIINANQYAFINVAPSPCAVGQTVTIDFFLGVPLQNSGYPVGFIIYVGLPGGTTTTLGPFIGDETGGSHTTYTPTATGTYTFYVTFPGQSFVYLGQNYYDEPATSATVTLVVTSTPASQYPFTPLPTTYWQTPVSAENVQNWYAIMGPWLGLGAQSFATTGKYNASTNYNPYTLTPTTGHILWTKPWAEGGIAGGDAGNTEESNYWITAQYEPKWAPVVINGIMYATWYTATTSDSNGIQAVNLYNGQTMFIINTTNPLRCGMVTYYQTINEYGYVGPYIWTNGPLPASQTGGIQYPTQPGTTQWNMYDALTGQYVASIDNGSSGSELTTDANGNLMLYFINNTAGTQIIYPNELSTNGAATSTTAAYTSSATVVTTTGPSLGMFNFTQALQTDMQNVVTSGATDWLWEPPLNHQYLFNLGIMAEVNIPSSMTSIPLWGAGGIGDNTLVLTGGNIYGEGAGGETPGYLLCMGYSTTNLALLWTTNITETPYARTSLAYGFGYLIQVNLENDVVSGYSMSTGDLVWTNTLTGYNGAAVNPYDTFAITPVPAYNPTLGEPVVYIYSFGGDMWALNLNNGDLIWYQNTTALFGSPGLETPYGTWPIWIFNNEVVTNTQVIYGEGHEYDPPLFHGAQLFSLNANNGQLVWKRLGFDTTGSEISYGIILQLNSYDGQVYAYGQGPSSTTVMAPNPVGTGGSPMVITGTVMDVSAGASQEAVKADFPNGLPCISDADQGHFMATVYEQQPMPTDMTGVPITVTAIDPNGNLVTLGTTTSLASGAWGLTWTPPAVPGNYTITATFAGTGAYYGSYAQTLVYVGSAPTPAPPTAAPVTGLASTGSLELGIALIAVIIIVIGAVLAVLVLRKKP